MSTNELDDILDNLVSLNHAPGSDEEARILERAKAWETKTGLSCTKEATAKRVRASIKRVHADSDDGLDMVDLIEVLVPYAHRTLNSIT